MERLRRTIFLSCETVAFIQQLGGYPPLRMGCSQQRHSWKENWNLVVGGGLGVDGEKRVDMIKDLGDVYENLKFKR